MLPGVVIALPGGVLMQRFGAVAIALVGLAAMAAGGALMGTTTSFTALVAGRLVSGTGAVLLNVALAVFLLWLRPRDRTARLLAVALVGTAAVFNLTAQGTLEVLPLQPVESVIQAGAHIVAVSFIKDTVKPAPRRNNSGAISSVTIRGPYNPTGSGETPSRGRIFTCRPAPGNENENACAKHILGALTRRVEREAEATR